MRYEPTRAPVPSEWLAADEGERLDAVLRYHKRMKLQAANLRTHSAIHVTVETQLAQSLQQAVRAMSRLTEGGLDRHEAIHAIGSVVAGQIYQVLKHRPFDSEAYSLELEKLTIDTWRRSYNED